MNPSNTQLSFDVTLYPYVNATANLQGIVRFQNNIQSLFSRVRLLYGSTPLEDMIEYNQIVRSMTEWTATNNQLAGFDQTSINEGIGGTTITLGGLATAGGGVVNPFGIVNIRQAFIQGVNSLTPPASGLGLNFTAGGPRGNVGMVSNNTITNAPAGAPSAASPVGFVSVTRRYCISFMLGLFLQEKLIPTKFMASQLAIEITLETAAGCIFSPTAGTGAPPTYSVGNVNLIPEILQFDASYGKNIIIIF